MAFENKLIHVTGPLTTPDMLKDPDFGVSTGTQNTTSALKLRRFVEMYQWQESSTSTKRKTANGGTRTDITYSYDPIWSNYLIDSNSFKKQNADTQNPAAFPFESLKMVADPILLGDSVTLSPEVTDLFNWYEPMNSVTLQDIPDDELGQKVTEYSTNGFYYGNGTNSLPKVGDTRITFDAVEPDTISIVALFSGNRLSPFTTSRGGILLLLKRGTFTANELFVQAEEENEQLTWILRFVGFVLMVISILLVLQPIATAVDIIPFIGDCMQGGLESCIFPTIAFLIAIPVTLFVIALAWLAYRPTIAIPILVGSLLVTICLCIRARNKKNESDQQPQYGKPQPNAPPMNPAYTTPASAPADMPGFAQALDTPPPTTQTTEADVYVPHQSNPY